MPSLPHVLVTVPIFLRKLAFFHVLYNLMFYLGRYSVWSEFFPETFANNEMFPERLKEYKPLIDELYNHLKNHSNETNYYIELKRLINYFKGAWVNFLNEKV